MLRCFQRSFCRPLGPQISSVSETRKRSGIRVWGSGFHPASGRPGTGVARSLGGGIPGRLWVSTRRSMEALGDGLCGTAGGWGESPGPLEGQDITRPEEGRPATGAQAREKAARTGPERHSVPFTLRRQGQSSARAPLWPGRAGLAGEAQGGLGDSGMSPYAPEDRGHGRSADRGCGGQESACGDPGTGRVKASVTIPVMAEWKRVALGCEKSLHERRPP